MPPPCCWLTAGAELLEQRKVKSRSWKSYIFFKKEHRMNMNLFYISTVNLISGISRPTQHRADSTADSSLVTSIPGYTLEMPGSLKNKQAKTTCPGAGPAQPLGRDRHLWHYSPQGDVVRMEKDRSELVSFVTFLKVPVQNKDQFLTFM